MWLIITSTDIIWLSRGARRRTTEPSLIANPVQLLMAMTNTAIAETYLEAVRTKDPRKALFAPGHTTISAKSPDGYGRESVIEYILAPLPGIDDVRLERHMTSSEYVASLWEAET